jgi:DNA-directed RNA polymerase alpha subunit
MAQESKERSKVNNIYIDAKEDTENMLKFTIKGLNVSFINALRRTILSDIQILGFQGFPHEKCSIKFEKNTTRLHNEILKQRLSCIPIKGIKLDEPYDNLVFEINETNDTSEMMYVTTNNFKIKDMETGKYLNKSTVEEIFPPDKITGDYIIIARLLPQISSEIPGESLKLTATIGIHDAKEDGVYNCVSCCTFNNTVDKVKQDDEWQKIISSLTEEERNENEIKIKKSDWYNHHSKRIYLKDTFDFKVETIGIYSNIEIVEKGCDVLIEKLLKLKNDILNIDEFNKILQKYSKSTISNSYDLTLFNEDYTIGKVVEYILHNTYYKERNILTYVGFRKNHPHDSYSIIRVAFKDKIKFGNEYDVISAIISQCCDSAIEIYESIKSDIK